MKSAKFVLFLTLAFVLIITGCGKSTDKAASGSAPSPQASGASSPQASSAAVEQEVVKIVTNNQVPFPKFYNIDANGNTSGYIVDYYKLLEERLPEYKFEYEAADFNGQLIGTETGKYDIAGFVWFKNKEREDKFVFSEPFGYSLTVLAVKNDRNDIHSLDDVVGKKLVPMAPNSGLRGIVLEYNRQHPGKEFKLTDVDKWTIAGDLQSVASGQYDVDFKNLTQFEAVNEELKLGLKIASLVTKEPAYFLFNKNKPELAEKFGKVTKELIEDGTLPKLSEKWFGFDHFKALEEIQQQLSIK